MSQELLSSIVHALRKRADNARQRQTLIDQGIIREGQLRQYAARQGHDYAYLAVHIADGKKFVEEYGIDIDEGYLHALLKALATPQIMAYLLKCGIGLAIPPDDPEIVHLIEVFREEFTCPI